MRFLKRIYAFFWRKTSGRPWTYEIRDWTRRHPRWAGVVVGFLVAVFSFGQIALPKMFGWKAAPFVAFADFLALLAGHLFWDTEGPYVKEKGSG